MKIEQAAKKVLMGGGIFTECRIMDVLKMAYGTYSNEEMLETSIFVYRRLYGRIGNLSAEKQFDIVHEATMIAYDARIGAFDHMINIHKELDDEKDS